MAGFLKLWTTLLSNRDWQKFSGMTRGIFLQLLLECKQQRDDGYVFSASMKHLCSKFAVDLRTFRKHAAFLEQKCFIEITENSDGVIIYIPQYIKWQTATVKEVTDEYRKNATKMSCPSSLPDQTRPDHSRPGDNGKIINPNKIEEIRYDQRKAIEIVLEWDEKNGDALRDELMATPGVDHAGWLGAEWDKYLDFVRLNEEDAKKSLANNYEGDVGRMFKRWIFRAKSRGGLNEYLVRK